MSTKKTKDQQTVDALVDDRQLVLGRSMTGDLQAVAIADILESPGDRDRLPGPDDDAAIAEIARSMREVGQLQPVMVEKVGATLRRVFGRRRMAAARMIGLTQIQAYVVEGLTPEHRRAIVAIENVQRSNLSPVEEHLAVADLMAMQAVPAAVMYGKPLQFGSMAGKVMTAGMGSEIEQKNDPARAAMRHDALLTPGVRALAAELVAAMLGKSPTWVRDRMYLGRLSPKARGLVAAGKLPLAHAREIAKVADAELRDTLAEEYASGGDMSISDTEAGRLDELKAAVGRRVFALAQAPWTLHVAVGACPACTGCPNNSATHPGLFEHGGRVSTEMRSGLGSDGEEYGKDDADAGVCLDHRCFERKLAAVKPVIAAAAKRVLDDGAKPEQAVPAKMAAAIRPLAVKERAAEMKARRACKPSGQAEQKSPQEAERQAREGARRKARLDWEEAMRERAAEIYRGVEKLCEKRPGLWTLLRLVEMSSLYGELSDYREPVVAKALAKPATAKVLKLLGQPVTLEAIVEMEKLQDDESCGLEPYHDGPSGFADKVAAALGIKVDPAPTVESFLAAACVAVKEHDQDRGETKGSGRQKGNGKKKNGRDGQATKAGKAGVGGVGGVA